MQILRIILKSLHLFFLWAYRNFCLVLSVFLLFRCQFTLGTDYVSAIADFLLGMFFFLCWILFNCLGDKFERIAKALENEESTEKYKRGGTDR